MIILQRKFTKSLTILKRKGTREEADWLLPKGNSWEKRLIKNFEKEEWKEGVWLTILKRKGAKKVTHNFENEGGKENDWLTTYIIYLKKR